MARCRQTEPSTDRTICHIDGRDASPILLTETGKSAHTFLPFYNEPVYSNASTEIFAARFGRYKAVRMSLGGVGSTVGLRGYVITLVTPLRLRFPRHIDI